MNPILIILVAALAQQPVDKEPKRDEPVVQNDDDDDCHGPPSTKCTAIEETTWGDVKMLYRNPNQN